MHSILFFLFIMSNYLYCMDDAEVIKAVGNHPAAQEIVDCIVPDFQYVDHDDFHVKYDRIYNPHNNDEYAQLSLSKDEPVDIYQIRKNDSGVEVSVKNKSFGKNIIAVAYNAQKKDVLIAGSSEGTVELWSLKFKNPECFKMLNNLNASIVSIIPNPSHADEIFYLKRGALTSPDRLCFWNTDSGEEYEFPPTKRELLCAAFNPHNSHEIATIEGIFFGSCVYIYDTKQKVCVRKLEYGGFSKFNMIAFNPVRKDELVAEGNREAFCCDHQSGELFYSRSFDEDILDVSYLNEHEIFEWCKYGRKNGQITSLKVLHELKDKFDAMKKGILPLTKFKKKNDSGKKIIKKVKPQVLLNVMNKLERANYRDQAVLNKTEYEHLTHVIFSNEDDAKKALEEIVNFDQIEKNNEE